MFKCRHERIWNINGLTYYMSLLIRKYTKFFCKKKTIECRGSNLLYGKVYRHTSPYHQLKLILYKRPMGLYALTWITLLFLTTFTFLRDPPGGPRVEFLIWMDTFLNDIGPLIIHFQFDQNWMKNVTFKLIRYDTNMCLYRIWPPNA